MLDFIFKPAVYIPLSYLVLVLYSLDNILLYQELFAVTIALSNSAIFTFLVWAVVLSSVQLYWIVLRTVFFGSLNTPEREVVSNAFKSRCIPFGLYVIITRSAHLQPFLMLTFATFVMHLLHKLAEERLITISALVNERWTKFQLYTRLVLFVMFAVIVDYLGLIFLWSMSPTLMELDYSLDFFYHITILLFIEHSFSITDCIVKIAFDHFYSEYENLSLVYVIDTTLLLMCNLVTLIYIIWLTVTGPARVYLFYPFVTNLENFSSRGKQLWRFARLMRVISQFPLASEEALLREQRCIICYEEMLVEQRCRELACGHCYHETCLQKWFLQQYTCPYCRADQLRNRPTTSTTEHVPPQNNNPNNDVNIIENDANVNTTTSTTTTTTNGNEVHEINVDIIHNDINVQDNHVNHDLMDNRSTINGISSNDEMNNKIDCNVSSDNDHHNTSNSIDITKTNTANDTTECRKKVEEDEVSASEKVKKENYTMHNIANLEFGSEITSTTTSTKENTLATLHLTEECEPDEKEIRQMYEWLKTTKCNFWKTNNNHSYQNDDSKTVVPNYVNANESTTKRKVDLASLSPSPSPLQLSSVPHCHSEHNSHHDITTGTENASHSNDDDTSTDNCKEHKANSAPTNNTASTSSNTRDDNENNCLRFVEFQLPILKQLALPLSESNDACTSVPTANINTGANDNVSSHVSSNNDNFTNYIDDPNISIKDKLVYTLKKYERQVSEAQQELDSSVSAIRQICPKEYL